MNITISDIFCSTAIITVDGHRYKVCYWEKHNTPSGGIYPPPEIVWVEDEVYEKVYELKPDGYHKDVRRLIPLFQALCDLNHKRFANICPP